MFVRDAMSANVRSCAPETNLEEIAQIMWDENCGSIPVIDQSGRPIGIVTDRDIAMTAMLNSQPLWDLSAWQIIEDQQLSCCHFDDDLEGCLSKMEEKSIRRLPVVNDSGYLSGILSMGDIVAFAADKTSKSKAKKGVSYSNVISMLKHVSAHHQPDKPIIAASN